MALIPQEAYVFAGTVRENLALFAPDADDADLLAAVGRRRRGPAWSPASAASTPSSATAARAFPRAKRSCSRLPGSTRTPRESSSWTKRPPISTRPPEARAERAFAARGGALVVIAHRLSSALRADRVLVMDGRHTPLGTHADLLATSPSYAAMMQAWRVPPSDTASAALRHPELAVPAPVPRG